MTPHHAPTLSLPPAPAPDPAPDALTPAPASLPLAFGHPLPETDFTNNTAALLDPVLPALAPIVACHPSEQLQIEPLEMVNRLKSLAASIAAGDTAYPETVATAQAATLNILFSRLADLAMHDVTSPHFDSCMRLAFRAQHQCIHTFEKLTAFRNRPGAPSVVAHQLNLAHQQIVHHNHTSTAAPAPQTPNSQT